MEAGAPDAQVRESLHECDCGIRTASAGTRGDLVIDLDIPAECPCKGASVLVFAIKHEDEGVADTPGKGILVLSLDEVEGGFREVQPTPLILFWIASTTPELWAPFHGVFPGELMCIVRRCAEQWSRGLARRSRESYWRRTESAP